VSFLREVEDMVMGANELVVIRVTITSFGELMIIIITI
jgi:hypothetical protein